MNSLLVLNQAPGVGNLKCIYPASKEFCHSQPSYLFSCSFTPSCLLRSLCPSFPTASLQLQNKSRTRESMGQSMASSRLSISTSAHAVTSLQGRLFLLEAKEISGLLSLINIGCEIRTLVPLGGLETSPTTLGKSWSVFSAF